MDIRPVVKPLLLLAGIMGIAGSSMFAHDVDAARTCEQVVAKNTTRDVSTIDINTVFLTFDDQLIGAQDFETNKSDYFNFLNTEVFPRGKAAVQRDLGPNAKVNFTINPTPFKMPTKFSEQNQSRLIFEAYQVAPNPQNDRTKTTAYIYINNPSEESIGSAGGANRAIMSIDNLRNKLLKFWTTFMHEAYGHASIGMGHDDDPSNPNPSKNDIMTTLKSEDFNYTIAGFSDWDVNGICINPIIFTPIPVPTLSPGWRRTSLPAGLRNTKAD